MEPRQYLGYTDGERVHDTRTGTMGHVRVRDDEEVGRYAEVSWDGSFVQEQLELAVGNGLSRPGLYVRDENVELGCLVLEYRNVSDREAGR